LGPIQRWQGEPREEGSGIHVVLHHGIGKHHIPLLERWIGAAGHARKQQEINVGRRTQQSGCRSSGAHLAPSAPGEAEADAFSPGPVMDGEVTMLFTL
jgi:hypothetical protein